MAGESSQTDPSRTRAEPRGVQLGFEANSIHGVKWPKLLDLHLIYGFACLIYGPLPQNGVNTCNWIGSLQIYTSHVCPNGTEYPTALFNAVNSMLGLVGSPPP